MKGREMASSIAGAAMEWSSGDAGFWFARGLRGTGFQFREWWEPVAALGCPMLCATRLKALRQRHSSLDAWEDGPEL